MRRSAPGLTATSAVVAAAFAAPLLYLVVRNAAMPGDLLAAWSSPRTLGPLARSVTIASGVAGASAAIGTAAAWVVVRTDVPLRRWWLVILPLPLVIPSFIGAFALLAAFAPGGLLEDALRLVGVERLPLVHGFWGAFAVLTLLTYPYVYLPVAARLAQLQPSLEEAARLLGRPPAQVFRTIVLPQIRPAILAGTLLVFLYAISDFGAVQLLRYDTLTRAIYATRLFDAPTSLALALELGVLALVVVALERTVTRGPMRVQQPQSLQGLQVPLGRWKPAATAFLVTVTGLALAAPVSVLGFWATRGLVRGSARASAFARDPGQLVAPAVNTAVVSVVAAVVAVAVVAPVAYLTVRHRTRVGDTANALVVGGFALPGLPIALALVFWMVRVPGPLAVLYQSHMLLVFAYVVHFGALALRSGQVAVATVPHRIDEAAQSLGARRLRRLWTVDLPLMAPGLFAGGGLVLLSTMKELPATLLLAPPGFQTLATKIWTSAEDAFLADASMASLVLIALSGLLTWVLVIRRGEVPE